MLRSIHPWVMRLGSVALLAGLLTIARVGADGRPYAVRVYLDRASPDRAVSVFDFRISQTLANVGGVQHLLLYSGDGTFNVPFELISEIVIHRPIGRSSGTAHYDATVRLKQGREARTGRLDLAAFGGRVNR